MFWFGCENSTEELTRCLRVLCFMFCIQEILNLNQTKYPTVPLLQHTTFLFLRLQLPIGSDALL